MLGQKAEVDDDSGEDDKDEEEGEGTAPLAVASDASDCVAGPYMLAWLASLEKLLYKGHKVIDGVEDCLPPFHKINTSWCFAENEWTY